MPLRRYFDLAIVRGGGVLDNAAPARELGWAMAHVAKFPIGVAL